jgi:hypothetical protein
MVAGGFGKGVEEYLQAFGSDEGGARRGWRGMAATVIDMKVYLKLLRQSQTMVNSSCHFLSIFTFSD